MKSEFYPKDGNHYADLIINDLRSFTNTEHEIPDFIIEYWEKEIRNLCVERFDSYLHGQGDFMLSDQDIMETYKKAIEKMTADTLEVLVDKGDIKMAVSEEGEIVYSLSEQGKKRI